MAPLLPLKVPCYKPRSLTLDVLLPKLIKQWDGAYQPYQAWACMRVCARTRTSFS